MKKDLFFDLDCALSNIECTIEPAMAMILDLTGNYFVFRSDDEDNRIYILNDYDRASIRANIALDYVLKLRDEIENLHRTLLSAYEGQEGAPHES